MTLQEQNKELKRLLSLAVEDIKHLQDYDWSYINTSNKVINAEIEDTTNKIEFTEDEIKMLKWIFASADAIVQARRTDNYDTTESNTLFYLIEKLDISDIVD